MSACPHCTKEIEVPDRAYFNADQYGKSSLVATLCCGKGVRIIPKRSYRFEAYTGREKEDDWGERLKP